LARQEHGRVLYRARNPEEIALESVVRRRAAFLDAAADRGLAVTEWRGSSASDASDDCIAAWLEADPSERPTAVVCWNDETAYHYLARCHKRGVRVPDDLALLGFDGLRTPMEAVWRLTTVRAPWMEVARTAVALLVAQLDGEVVPQE